MTDPLLITAPTIEPLTVAEFKIHNRLDIDDEDDLIEAYITAARQLFEDLTGRTLHETTWEVALDEFPRGNCPIELPRAAPLISITHIKYVDNNGNITTWGTSNYTTDTYRMPGLVMPVYGNTWPSFTPAPSSAVQIRYKAGIAIGSPQTYPPEGIRQTIREMVAALFLNREQVTVTDRFSVMFYAENPMTKTLLQNYMVKRVF